MFAKFKKESACTYIHTYLLSGSVDRSDGNNAIRRFAGDLAGRHPNPTLNSRLAVSLGDVTRCMYIYICMYECSYCIMYVCMYVCMYCMYICEYIESVLLVFLSDAFEDELLVGSNFLFKYLICFFCMMYVCVCSCM